MPRTSSRRSPESNHPPVARGDEQDRSTSATTRLLASVGVGALVGTAVSFAGPWQVALLVGWMAAAALFVVWMWLTIWPMDARATAAHAVRENPGRAATDATFPVSYTHLRAHETDSY